MTKRSRTLLFLVFGALFVLAAPAIILFAQGYRFDWDTKQIAKVGAFYFAVIPAQADVLVNGEFVGTTAPLRENIFISNLLPQTYTVEIQKTGFQTWQKNLLLAPKQVTEAKHIMLFPEHTSFRALQENVAEMWLAPNQNQAVIKKPISRTLWELSLWDMERNTVYPLYVAQSSRDDILEIIWAADSAKFLMRVVSQEQVKTFVQHIDRQGLSGLLSRQVALQIGARDRVPLAPLANEIVDIAFAPFSDQQVLYTKPSGNVFVLSLADYLQGQEMQQIASSMITFGLQGQSIFWLDDKGTVWKKTSLNAEATPINSSPLPMRAETSYELYAFGDEILIKEFQKLYRLERETHTFKEMFLSAGTIAENPDRQKVAIANGSEIWILFLADQAEQPIHQKGETVFLTRFSAPVENLAWITSWHLLFSVQDTVKITEIDERDRPVTMDIGQFAAPQLFWQNTPATISVVSNGTVSVSETLLP